MLLFSATFEESVWNFAKRIVPDPNIIKLKREEETLDTIKQYYVQCTSKEEKFQALCNIYGAITIAQAMVFCHVSPRSRRAVAVCFVCFSVCPAMACLGSIFYAYALWFIHRPALFSQYTKNKG